MALDRQKLLALRNNIQAYLNSIEKDEPDVGAVIDDQLSEFRHEMQEKFDSMLLPMPPVQDNSELLEAVRSIQMPKIKFPDPIDRTDEIVQAISEIRFPEIEWPNSISVNNFPPQKIPQPVTNININGLRGPVKSTAVEVTTTPTPLPDTPLANRRSLIAYNNSDQTIYIGDENVTTATGIPVCKQNYTPALDLGVESTLYAVTETGTADVRVLESSLTGTV